MTNIATDRLGHVLNTVQHLAPLIRQYADASEREHRLAPEIVSAFVEARLFRLYLPQTLNGAELDPLSFATVLEAIARIDGSTGWCT